MTDLIDRVNQKPEVRIENWYFKAGHLFGNVIDHPRFAKGTFIGTSQVINHSMKTKLVETLDSLYVLVGDRLKEKAWWEFWK